MNYIKIDALINDCELCGDLVEKFPDSKTISFGKSNNIIIVGEAPANNGWRKSGIAWYDSNNKLLLSGIVMQKLLNILNLRLEDTTFLEGIKCYPISRKNLNKCSENCSGYLFMQLKELKPKIVLILGDCATRTILKIKYKRFSDVAGKIYKDNNITFIPIYHPSPISPNSYKSNIPIFNYIKGAINNEKSVD